MYNSFTIQKTNEQANKAWDKFNQSCEQTAELKLQSTNAINGTNKREKNLPSSLIARNNHKMSTLSRVIYRFNIIPIKILTFFTDT